MERKISIGPDGKIINWDEIPGYTSWIYSQNRPRRLDEYVNNDATERKERYKDLERKNIQYEMQIADLEDEVESLKDKLYAINDTLEEERETINEIKKYFNKYGCHIKDCSIYTLRTVNGIPLDTKCDCGYSEVGKKFSNESPPTTTKI